MKYFAPQIKPESEETLALTMSSKEMKGRKEHTNDTVSVQIQTMGKSIAGNQCSFFMKPITRKNTDRGNTHRKRLRGT